MEKIFNIFTGQFENFQFNITGLDIDVDRGFPIGDFQSLTDMFPFIRAIFGVDDLNSIVKDTIEDEVTNYYGTLDPNAFIAEQLDLLSNYNFGPIDGIPVQYLLPIIAESVRDFDETVELYVERPDNNPMRSGLLEVTLTQPVITQAKSLYYAQN